MDICLVEDNPGDILMIQTALEDLDLGGNTKIDFIVKTNGLSASMFIRESEKVPDLIVLDLNLPYKNGFEILSEILGNDVFKTVPVIIFTSSSDQMDTVKALSMGAKAYIIKPIDFDEYQIRVKSFLQYIN